MADLHAIYQELGLPGLVPHALRANSKGRQMLIDKIKAGDPLYFIRSKLDAPFILVKGGDYQSYAFTSQEEAEAKCSQFGSQRFDTMVEAFPGGTDRDEAIRWLFDHGPSAIFIDDSISIPLSQFAELPAYDGQPNEEHLLRNRRLNGALFYYLQIACAQMSNMEAEHAWAKSMYGGKFLLMAENDPGKGYPILTSKTSTHACALAYTDWRQASMDFESIPAGIVSSFDDLEQVLKDAPDLRILLNAPTCHLVMDLSLFDTIRRIVTDANYHPAAPAVSELFNGQTQRAAFGQVAEEDWDKIDPTPDWLK